jgi:hypothetical protein
MFGQNLRCQETTLLFPAEQYTITALCVGKHPDLSTWGEGSAHSLNPYAYFGHSWSYFDIQNLQLVISYTIFNWCFFLIEYQNMHLTKM